MGEKEPFDDPSETHAKCEDCLQKQKEKTLKLMEEAADITRPGFPSKELLERTIKEWQPYYKEPLAIEDAREIVINVCNYFDLLIKMDRQNSLKSPTNIS